MSKVADSIRRGLEQAVTYAKGEADLRAYRVHVPPAFAGAGSSGSTGARPARVPARNSSRLRPHFSSAQPPVDQHSALRRHARTRAARTGVDPDSRQWYSHE